MPLLTVVNLRTSTISFQDSTGQTATSFSVKGSTTLTDKVVSDLAMEGLEAQLKAAATAGHITWTLGDDPTSTGDNALATAPQALTGAGAINVTTNTTLFTSSGVGQALTLAAGTALGQRKRVIHTVRGGGTGTGVITPAAAGNLATATLTALRDWVEFEWSGAAWNVVGWGGTASFT